jgi:hypothetical protein
MKPLAKTPVKRLLRSLDKRSNCQILPLKLRKERAGAIKSLKFDELHSNSSANNPKSDTLLGL